MDITVINELIDNLCERFGTTTAFLISEMSKYYAARYAVATIFSIIAIAIATYIFYSGMKKYRHDLKKYEESESRHCLRPDPFDEDYSVYFIPSGIMLIISSLIFLVAVIHLVGWVVSPTAAFFNEVVKSFFR